MFSAYNAATRKMSQKLVSKDTDQLGTLVAGVAARALADAEARKHETIRRLEEMEREIRDANRTLRLRGEEVAQLQAANNPTAIKTDLSKKIKNSVAFQEGMIDDFKLVGQDLFITTANLSFAASKMRSHKGNTILLSGQNIGRFLIMIRLAYYANHNPISTCIQIVNLTWRVSNGNHSYHYHHPFIKERGDICFGNTQADFQKYFRTADVVGIIDLALALLVTPNDGNAWISWNEYFTERQPLEKTLAEGESYWVFANGPRSLERYTADPKKKKMWAKVMKDLIGSGWVGMIEASQDPIQGNRHIWDELNNLFTLLNENPDRYKGYLQHLNQQVPRQVPLIWDESAMLSPLQDTVTRMSNQAYEEMIQQQYDPNQHMARYINEMAQGQTTTSASTTGTATSSGSLTASNINQMISNVTNIEDHPF